ncbi:MAG: tRNA 2-thiouridine(34) synthase MnmA [Candidatus Rariloculaceae bacterium]
MTGNDLIIVALSGGVDSAVTALLLREAGHDVQCLHMSNWEDDGYCEAAKDFQDAREIARRLDLPLHRVNFTDEYRDQVFASFLEEYAAGRTPNPDVLCNRQIKFGEMRRYAERLGGTRLATGHYARLNATEEGVQLLKGRDQNKDQSYFLHAVSESEFDGVQFPLGELTKQEVRDHAASAGLPVAEKKDSTGICFIGERPFAEFLGEYLPVNPGEIKTPNGDKLGEHQGIAYYTLGQRQGLRIGGLAGYGPEPWYVAGKVHERNELIAVQGGQHPLLFKNWLSATDVHWINSAPMAANESFRCRAKTRYRQPDQACTVTAGNDGTLEVLFDEPQRAITPGQYVVFYQEDRCLGGATIQSSESLPAAVEAAG